MLVAWRGGRTWTEWHVLAGPVTRCGLRIPPLGSRLHPQTRTEMTVARWQLTCAPCREAVVRSTTEFRQDPTTPKPAA